MSSSVRSPSTARPGGDDVAKNPELPEAAAMPSSDARLLDQCQRSWSEEFIPGLRNSGNCSGFLKSVAAGLGVKLPGELNADGLVAHLERHWRPLPSGEAAAAQAAAGWLVVAGLASLRHTPPRRNGHVAIVVAGPLYRGKYPRVWCGSLGGAQSRGEKSVGEVWNRTDRDAVSYHACALSPQSSELHAEAPASGPAEAPAGPPVEALAEAPADTKVPAEVPAGRVALASAPQPDGTTVTEGGSESPGIAS